MTGTNLRFWNSLTWIIWTFTPTYCTTRVYVLWLPSSLSYCGLSEASLPHLASKDMRTSLSLSSHWRQYISNFWLLRTQSCLCPGFVRIAAKFVSMTSKPRVHNQTIIILIFFRCRSSSMIGWHRGSVYLPFPAFPSEKPARYSAQNHHISTWNILTNKYLRLCRYVKRAWSCGHKIHSTPFIEFTSGKYANLRSKKPVTNCKCATSTLSRDPDPDSTRRGPDLYVNEKNESLSEPG